MEHVKNKLLAVLAGAVLVACVLFGASRHADVGRALVPEAEAQSVTDEWAGKPQQELSFHGSLSSEAVIFSAVAGKTLVLKSITMSSSVTGTLNLYDGSGSTIVDQFDLIASHDPITIDQKRLGKGIALSKGNGLYGQLTSGTAVTFSARVETD